MRLTEAEISILIKGFDLLPLFCGQKPDKGKDLQI